MDAPTKPRKSPKQARSRATVDAICEAAARILEEAGIGAINTNAVASRAGVAIGSLYQYFQSKEAILAELVRRDRTLRSERIGTALTGFEEKPMPELVAAAVKAAIDHQYERPRLSLALEQVELLIPLAAPQSGVDEMLLDPLAELFAARGYSPASVIARDIIAMTKGMIDTATLFGEPREGGIEQRVCAAILGYLEAMQRADFG